MGSGKLLVAALVIVALSQINFAAGKNRIDIKKQPGYISGEIISRVKFKSCVVWPRVMPSCLSKDSSISSAPRTWQAVPRQTLTMCFPLLFRLKARKKVAML